MGQGREYRTECRIMGTGRWWGEESPISPPSPRQGDRNLVGSGRQGGLQATTSSKV